MLARYHQQQGNRRRASMTRAPLSHPVHVYRQSIPDSLPIDSRRSLPIQSVAVQSQSSLLACACRRGVCPLRCSSRSTLHPTSCRRACRRARHRILRPT